MQISMVTGEGGLAESKPPMPHEEFDFNWSFSSDMTNVRGKKDLAALYHV